MSEMVQYRARRAFKYNGRWLKAGELWQPGGSRHDASIIRHGLVATERLPRGDAGTPNPEPGETDEPQMAPAAVEAARSERRMAKAVAGPEPRPGAGGPR